MKKGSSSPLLEYDLRYCMLLKMVWIQLANPSLSRESKLEKLLDFCDSEINAIPLREVLVSKDYFDKGQALKFFGKIQTGRDDILINLRNMAWDFFHVSHMEESISNLPEEGAEFFIPSFMTFDKRLIEIIYLRTIKAIGYSIDKKIILPVYAQNDLLAGLDSKNNIADYFSPDSRNSRFKRNRIEKDQGEKDFQNNNYS